MPGFDATGPGGMGPGTGWCGAGWRRGEGCRMGRGAGGRGRWAAGGGRTGVRGRYGFQALSPVEPAGASAPGDSPDEVAALKMELKTLRQRLAALENPQSAR